MASVKKGKPELRKKGESMASSRNFSPGDWMLIIRTQSCPPSSADNESHGEGGTGCSSTLRTMQVSSSTQRER